MPSGFNEAGGRDERGWQIDPRGPRRPFGSALTAIADKRIETPEPINTNVRKLRGTPPCPQCGNRGPWQCDCEGDDE